MPDGFRPTRTSFVFIFIFIFVVLSWTVAIYILWIVRFASQASLGMTAGGAIPTIENRQTVIIMNSDDRVMILM